MARIDGTQKNDLITGGDADDVLRGFGGDDEMFGGGGNDRLEGGEGRDYLRGGSGDDVFVGTDALDGTINDDFVFFHEQTRVMTGLVIDLNKGTGTDGVGGRDTYIDIGSVTGSRLDDTIRGTGGDNQIFGEGGDDVLDGRGGYDFTWYGRATAGVTVDLAAGTATGGAGRDTLRGFEAVGGSNHQDAIYGTDRSGVREFFRLDAYQDPLAPRSGKGTDDFLNGRGGTDAIGYEHTDAAVTVNLDKDKAIDGSGHTDTLKNVEDAYGSQAGDRLTGAGGEANLLSGQGGSDSLYGLSGADALYGDGGKDLIEGGKGGDTLDGGRGADRLTGGSGDDRFLFASARDGGDRIRDFRSGGGERDRIEIDASGFGGGLQAGGALASGKFRERGDNHAQDANDRFILRTTDDTLWFDADGKGGEGPTLVADLQSGAHLDASDIILI